MTVDLAGAVAVAKRVVTDEASALQATADSLGQAFSDALTTILDCSQTIVTGLGKSGVIARKIAATLTSTGSPAVYMHPVEALHGDLGLTSKRHCLLVLSRSGATEEILRFVSHFRRLGGPVIAVTQRAGCRLTELAQRVILLPDMPEAGPLSLAPTTSCVMQLAVGDALAMALLHARGFKAEDFAQYHPEGSLGKRLLLRAADLMHAGERLPAVPAEATFAQLLLVMNRKQLGLALIVGSAGELVGTFTDGDLRRLFERVDDPRGLTARCCYEKSRRSADAPPVRASTVPESKPAVDCLQLMQDSQITSLVVVDEARRPVGLLRLIDLVSAGL